MKAISLWQPWASLLVTRRPCERRYPGAPCDHRVEIGGGYHYYEHPMVKTVETRSWPCPPKLIGQRIALRATAKAPMSLVGEYVGDWQVMTDGGDSWSMRHGPTFRQSPAYDNPLAAVHVLFPDTPEARACGHVRLPLGAIVGSGIVADCLPIVECPDDLPDSPALIEFTPGLPGAHPRLHLWPEGEDEKGVDISDHLPYGNFAPGRYAWLIDDAAPTTERCPWCWGVGDVDEHDSVRGHLCPFCAGDGRCDPIPANGRQRIWEWTPTTEKAAS